MILHRQNDMFCFAKSDVFYYVINVFMILYPSLPNSSQVWPVLGYPNSHLLTRSKV